MNQQLKLASFIDRLKQFKAKQEGQQINEFHARLSEICDKLPALQEQERAYEAKTAPAFNVFRILRLERKEVLVHTPVLADLLNPRGTHKQGVLFLKSFFRVLQAVDQSLLVPSLDGNDRWRVEAEKFTEIEKATDRSYGNIDLLLSCRSQSYILAVENKIGAREQPDQLGRYWRWLCDRRKDYRDKLLIFLTPEGRAAKNVQATTPYIRLSYHEQVRDWLKGTLDQIQSGAVRAIIEQYVQIIECC